MFQSTTKKLIWIALLWLCAHVEAFAKDQATAVNALTTALEFGHYFQTLSDRIDPEIAREEQDATINRAQAAKISEYTRKVFSRDNLLEFSKQEISRRTKPELLEAFRKWHLTPIGQKHHEALKQRDKPSYETDKAQYFATYASAKIKSNRLNVLRTYLVNSRTVDLITETERGARYAVEMGRNGLRPRGTQERFSVVYNRLKVLATYMTTEREDLFNDYVYLLRDFSNGEIDTLSKYFTSVDNGRLIGLAHDAYTTTIQLAGKTVTDRLMKERFSNYIPDL